jgi:hypothetical protein
LDHRVKNVRATALSQLSEQIEEIGRNVLVHGALEMLRSALPTSAVADLFSFDAVFFRSAETEAV